LGVASVAAFPWNQWQLCRGIGGSFRVEQVAALAWNQWQDSPGIGGSFDVEYARYLQIFEKTWAEEQSSPHSPNQFPIP
jgi:hypothetical protein